MQEANEPSNPDEKSRPTLDGGNSSKSPSSRKPREEKSEMWELLNKSKSRLGVDEEVALNEVSEEKIIEKATEEGMSIVASADAADAEYVKSMSPSRTKSTSLKGGANKLFSKINEKIKEVKERSDDIDSRNKKKAESEPSKLKLKMKELKERADELIKKKEFGDEATDQAEKSTGAEAGIQQEEEKSEDDLL